MMTANTPETPPPDEEPWQEPEEPPAPHPPRQDKTAKDEPPDMGLPAGQLLAGLLGTLTLGGFGLYQTLGALGLLAGAGGTAACGAGYGYWRWRRAHPGRNRSRRERGSKSSHHSPAGGRAGRRMTFGATTGPGRTAAGRGRTSTSPRMPSLSGRSGRAAGRHLFTGGRGSPGHHTGAFRPNPKHPVRSRAGGSGSRRAAGGAVHHAGTVRVAAQRLASTGRTIRRRAASPRLDAHAADLARRAVGGARGARHRLVQAGQALRRRTASPRLDQRAAEAARRAGRWIDQRTGQRASTAWAAALEGGRAAAVTALRSRYRRWDAETVAALVAGWAWLTRRWRRPPANPTPCPPPEPAAPAAGATPAAPQPQPAPSVPHPASAGRTPPMSSFTLLQAAIELPGAAAAYHSDDMMDVDAHMENLDEVTASVATGFRIWADRLRAEYPIHEDVVERLEEMYSSLAKIGAQAQEVSEVFKARHEKDIARRVTPRVGERKWNVQ
ncbi:hypothetical protein OG884_18975 [Streptosporangium sp. NBC_01755]|uniref:hypothetical protein n=1 Tax=Streptosporangium sp. NBC_01755 TaxID=2975949 RepID=UPI002DDC4E7D|nr:hypothetical protein [Streptosporangium sp. NBC_01755]WSD03893.1 hypothetical protein OG884_18975 [Streptosporangium sp. NBC_01755]